MQGFLGEEGAKSIPHIRKRAPDWFELAEATNAFCHDLMLGCSPNKGSGQHMLAAVLFNRVLSAFQAVVLLTERGMFTEARVQRRSLLEALFVLGAIWQQPDLVPVYVKNHQHRRRDLYKHMRKISKEGRAAYPNLPTEEEIDKTLGEIDAAIKGVRFLGTETLAQAAKLHDLYLIQYTVLSGAAHHVPKDLDSGFDLDEHGEIRSLKWGPAEGSPIPLLLPAMQQVLMAAHVMSVLFSIDVKEKRTPLDERLREIADRDQLKDDEITA
jgi:hypothetical protein